MWAIRTQVLSDIRAVDGSLKSALLPLVYLLIALQLACQGKSMLCMCRHFFQGVHMLLTFGSSAEGLGQPWQPGERRANKLVFIGRNLDREQLRSDFEACII